MDYEKVYNNLIEKRRKYPLDRGLGGCENHHILPRAEGGTDISENIIRLTVKEHIFAHQLLARIYDDDKMWSAAHIMLFTKCNENNKCLRLAEIARKKIIESRIGRHPTEDTRRKMSESNKGEKNGFYGKHHSLETRKRWSEKRKGKRLSDLAYIRSRETCIGKPAWNRGISPSDETRRKISAGNKGKKVSLETRKKLSDALKGRKIRPEIVEKMRRSQLNNKSSMAVVQYDKNMNFVAEYKSTRDASRITGFSSGNISRCCNGKLKTVKGFIWRFR